MRQVFDHHAFDVMSVENGIIVVEKLDDAENKVCLDLIMEQRFLWEIGQKYKIEYLIDYWQRDEDNIRNLNTQANFVGVQHVIGDQKYSLLNKCISALQKINPDIYQKSYEKLQSYI